MNSYKEDYQELNNKFKKHGLCPECNHPKTFSDFCHQCNFQQFKDKPISDNQKVNQFLQDNQLKSTDRRQILECIPYEQFTDVEHIANGGFGKVYKAKLKKDNQSKLVALKSLNNSQGITEDFLQEIANHKLFYKDNRIVKCHGISQNPQTNDYVMVMDYIKDGDLRKFLKDNQLTFKDKLDQL
jgi:Protein tyrosine and serine/threonine kinase